MSQIAVPVSFPMAPDVPASRTSSSRSSLKRHYRIGPVPVTFSCEVDEVAEAFHRYYRPYEVFIPSRDSFHIEVRTRRSWRSWRQYYNIFANGCQQCTLDNARSILPFVEWTMNACVAKFLPDYLQIHAATVSRDGCGAIIAGSPGQGKSTLAAGLLACGWSYFSDEFALIHRNTGILHAYPKALCVKAGSFESVLKLGLPLDVKNVLHKGGKGLVSLIDPLAIRPDAISQPCPVGMIIFPHYEANSQPAIEPMSRAQAVFELVQMSFNFTKFRNKGLELLGDIARHAVCIRLRTSDLATTCALLETSLNQWRQTGRLSA